MTHDHHEVVERSSGAGAVAVVAIVILVVLAVLAVMAFGGLNWLRGDQDNDTIVVPGDGQPNPGVLPTVPVEPPGEQPPAPAPGGFYQLSPGLG